MSHRRPDAADDLRSRLARVAQRVDDLIAELGLRDFPDADTICRTLAQWGKDDDGGWLGIWLAKLAGARHTHEAVPILVERLHVDGDFLLEQATESLSRASNQPTRPPK